MRRRYLFENIKSTKIVFVYAGGFQPFGYHHKQVYNQFSKISNSNTIITTAGAKNEDSQDTVGVGKKSKSAKRDFFNFHDKQKIISDIFHINKNLILNIKNNYQMQPEIENYLFNILHENDVVLVWVVGEKDSSRAFKHLPIISMQELNSNANSLENRITLEDNKIKFDEQNLGYMLVSPNITSETSGNILSASAFRNLVQDPTKMLNEKLEGFRNYFNQPFNKDLQTHLLIFQKLLEKPQFDDFMKSLNSEVLNENKYLKNIIKKLIINKLGNKNY